LWGKKDLTVLVVDDEPETVELLTDMLESEDYKVLQAYGGQEGIDLAIEKHPDSIILDLMMPEVNGFDVVQQLRAYPEAMEIPILIYTSKDLTEEDRQRLNSHVQAIASKSASGKEDLLQALERLGRIRKRKG
jgi:CheY-like chemotaxis protein